MKQNREPEQIRAEINGPLRRVLKMHNRRKDRFFDKWCWENLQNNELGPLSGIIHTKKINSKWTQDLCASAKTIKLLEESFGGSFMTLILATISWV
jgi:hypothetical protein